LSDPPSSDPSSSDPSSSDPTQPGDPKLAQSGLKRLKPLFMIVALGFVLYSAWDLSHRWQKTRVSLDLPWALASIIPLALGCLIQGRGWIALIERMTARTVPRGPALSLYMDSQLARYTPGMVGLPFVRMAGAVRLGVPAVAVGSSVGLEMLSWTAVGGALGFASLFCLPAQSGLTALLGAWAIPIVLGFAASVLVLTFVDRTRLPAFVVRVLKVSGSGPLVPLSLPIAHVLYWTTWAAHGFLLTRAFGAPPVLALSTSGLYALATVGGFVALAAPAGVGVREAILSLSLAPALGSAPALGVAVASRAASLCADLLVWAVLKRWR
jgi:glycosyltransferase 2 family protein